MVCVCQQLSRLPLRQHVQILCTFSVIGTDLSLHWRAANLLDNSIWNCSLVAASCSFLQSNLGLLKGFPLVVLRRHRSKMLTIRWSESNSTVLYMYALQFLKEFDHLLLIRMWSNWCFDPILDASMSTDDILVEGISSGLDEVCVLHTCSPVSHHCYL